MNFPAESAASPWKRVLPGLLFALLVVGVYADPLFFRRNFAGRDLAVYNLPMEKAMHDAYARGRLPVWMPEISGGRPLLPNPNAGALYPVRPILSVLPFPLAMRLFPILHWIAAGIGMIFLLRSLGASGAGAWIGAVTYVFSGVGISEVFFPNLHPGMALLPWIVFVVARPAARWRQKIVLLSLFFGLDLLAGDVFTIGMAIVSSIVWIGVEKGKGERLRELLVLGVSLAAAGLLAAPQILATALWIPETNRAVLGIKLGEALFFSISPARLLEFVVPFPFGNNWTLEYSEIWGWPVFRFKGMGMFLSLYAGAFALIALVSCWRESSSGLRFARLLLLAALAVSVIPSALPSAWYPVTSPLPLRNPEKFAVAIVLALAICAGRAVDRFRQRRRVPRWTLAVAAAMTVLAAAIALWRNPAGRLAVTLVGANLGFARTAAARLPGAAAEGAILWTLTVIALDRMTILRRSSFYLSLALLTVVPLLATRKIARTLAERDLFSPTHFARIVQRADPRGTYRTIGETRYLKRSSFDVPSAGLDPVHSESGRRSWLQHAQALWNRGTVFNSDVDVGDFSRLESLRKISVMAAGYRDSATFFATFSLRWGIRFRDQEPLPGYHRFGGDGFQDWDVLESAEPDIRLARSWKEETGAMTALAMMPTIKQGGLVLETGRRREATARPGIIRVLVKEPERLSIETVTLDPSWLFVLRGFWNHRTVRLDGREVDYVPAQLAFSAVEVPVGRHRIEWEERVPGGDLSRWGPVGWLAFAATLLAASRSEGRSA